MSGHTSQKEDEEEAEDKPGGKKGKKTNSKKRDQQPKASKKLSKVSSTVLAWLELNSCNLSVHSSDYSHIHSHLLQTFKITPGEELAERMLTVVEKWQESFFIVELRSDMSSRIVRDPDPNISSEIMDGREAFLWCVCVWRAWCSVLKFIAWFQSACSIILFYRSLLSLHLIVVSIVSALLATITTSSARFAAPSTAR